MYQSIGLMLVTNHGSYPVAQHPTLNQAAQYMMKEYNSGRPIDQIVFRCIPYNSTPMSEILGRKTSKTENSGQEILDKKNSVIGNCHSNVIY